MTRHMTSETMAPIDSIMTPAIDKLRAQGVYPDAYQEWHTAQAYAFYLTPREIIQLCGFRAADPQRTLDMILMNLCQQDARWVLQDLVYEITE